MMRRLYRMGLTTTSGGNISAVWNGLTLITSSQTDKANMKAREIGIIDEAGNNLTPALKLSMETGMHQAIYQTRPDVKAIVHAHPPFSTAFAVAGKTINTSLMGESWAVLQQPVVAPYALMGSEELAQKVARAATQSDIILMANHGVVALGSNILEAFDRIEVLENCAKVNILVQLLGSSKSLDTQQQNDINQLFGK